MSATHSWSPEQAAFLDWVERGRGSAVLEAVAGAGKTTTLVEAASRMRGSVFLGAYNQKMGAELKQRVARRGLKNVRASTMHGAGFGALLYKFRGEMSEPDDKKVRRLADDVVAVAAQHDEREADYLRAIAPAALVLVGMAKQVGFLVRGLCERPMRADWEAIFDRYDVAEKMPDDYTRDDQDRCFDLARSLLSASNRAFTHPVGRAQRQLDFDDMIYLPLLMNLSFFKNDWVLLDEAQDTNGVRRELARRMLKPSGRLVAVGDPHQAIFGFTGADNDSLSRIRDQFDAQTLHLSVSWRCPQLVVAVAREYVDHIRPAPTAAEGEHLAVTYIEMRELVAPGDAILCRFNAPLVELCFALIRDGKPAKIEGRAIGEGLIALTKKWRVAKTDTLRDRLEKWFARETEKAREAENEGRVSRLEDQLSTITCLIDRGADRGITTVDGLREMIRSMFDDVGAARNLVVLSSVHRSKGLEWPRVFILGRDELMGRSRSDQEWQHDQETNLCYVAVTRAQETLVDFPLPTAEDHQAIRAMREKAAAAAGVAA